MNHKPLILGLALAAITSAGVIGIQTVSASTNATQPTSIVDAIASHFNLNKTEVQQVFDATYAQNEVARATQEADQLKQLVTDGKLTQAQADLITTKRTEMKSTMDSLKDKTAEERKTAMDAKRTELEQWAKDNGIDMQYLRPAGGPGGRHGGPRGGDMPAQSSTTTAQ